MTGSTRTWQSTTRAPTRKKHTTVFSFSLPQTSQPLFARAMEFLKRLRRLAKANCCDRVYAEKVEKHKSYACYACGNLPYFEQSFGCDASARANALAGCCTIVRKGRVKLEMGSQEFGAAARPASCSSEEAIDSARVRRGARKRRNSSPAQSKISSKRPR